MKNLADSKNSALSERRKTDREEMARRVIALVSQYENCTAEIDDTINHANTPHELWVRITAPRGVYVTFDLDGKSRQPDTFILSWNIRNLIEKIDACGNFIGFDVPANPTRFDPDAFTSGGNNSLSRSPRER